MTQPGCSVAIWNVQWAAPSGRKGRRIKDVLASREAEVIAVTEGCEGNLPAGGHVITSAADFGYEKANPSRRKVLLWSRNGWAYSDSLGHEELPPGRFVRGTTITSLGELTVIGLCIPFGMAHVSSGQRNRKPWQDHRAYLAALGSLLPRFSERTIVVGDFNQTIPRSTQPHAIAELLKDTFRDWNIATTGPLLETKHSIDHLAHSPDLAATSVTAWSAQDAEVGQLSDHFGVRVQLTA